MNSIWNKNIALFRTRFPALSDMLGQELAAFESGAPLPFSVQPAKNGSPTALLGGEGGIPLHSKYNPEREAEQLTADFDGGHYAAAAFLGFGLGYAPLAFARRFPSVPLILVEPDPLRLFAAFSALDWQDVLEHAQVTFAVRADEETAAQLLCQYKAQALRVYTVAAQASHAEAYFAAVTARWQRTRQKEAVNENTLERFSRLWLRNSCRNLHFLGELDGVRRYFGAAQGLPLPFIVLAAGPSLQGILPYLARLKERAVLVCVDTALHACLGAGVEPDFIVLVDPQYYCAQHLAFLQSPSSVLITESAAWPSVFRFACKETVLCSSLFPIGQYFERQIGKKGDLGAGGSVATTAWDFARRCGAVEIYLAGMDLGFPGKQTHIRGSQFEERAHRSSTRTAPAETDGVHALLGAQPATGTDYDGKPLLTDKRMSLFSWWFETNCATALQDGQRTFCLTPQSLAIAGIVPADVRGLCDRPVAGQARGTFFSRAAEAASPGDARAAYQTAYEDFLHVLDDLHALAKKGRALCEKGIRDRAQAAAVCRQLQDIDARIMGSQGKEAASLVFPTPRQLERLAKDIPPGPLAPLYHSRLIYAELDKAVQEYRAVL